MTPADHDPCCPACGIRYVDHLGLNGTCRKLQVAHSALKIISTWATFDAGAELKAKGTAKLCRRVLKEIAP